MEKSNTLQNVAEFIWEMVKTAITVIVVVFIIKTYLFQLFQVDGQSMEPTLHHQQMLLVDKLSYHFRQPARGEIIVFAKPKEENIDFIKRVIGIPGDKVIIKDSHVYIANAANPEGKLLDEKYLPIDLPTNGNQEITVEANQVFVLGDNRTNSQDSRVLGTISTDHVLGRALFTYWPIKTAQWIIAPKYSLSLLYKLYQQWYSI